MLERNLLLAEDHPPVEALHLHALKMLWTDRQVDIVRDGREDDHAV